jgi:tRNA A37 threonylcarbamoyladenosine dehydratase
MESDVSPTFSSRFSRTVDLYGDDAFARVRSGGAVVVGLGGVGAHAAVALARSGVGRLFLVDHDVITASSLNRHPVAGPADVGRGKAEVLGANLAATCPDTETVALSARVAPATVADLIGAEIRARHGVLVDCIDSVTDKVALLTHASALEWRTVCSLGAAGKRDGGLVRTGTLADTRVCPLARRVRRGARDAGVAPGDVAAVWSEEAPVPPVTATVGARGDDDAGGRRRQPSNMMLPGMFGYAVAALALDLLAGRR